MVIYINKDKGAANIKFKKDYDAVKKKKKSMYDSTRQLINKHW